MKKGLYLAVALATASCSTIHDLPPDSQAAFSVPQVGRDGTTLMETISVKTIPISEALKYADEAFTSTNFELRPEDRLDRRCGEYTTGFYDWAMWGCFYFQEAGPQLKVRVIVESWGYRSIGSRTRQPWHLHLTNAFKNRIGSP